MNLELSRQRDKIELIASENIVSEAVLEAMGTVLTNKYAEGYPGKRFYGGCEYVISWRISLVIVRKNFSALSMRTFNRIPAHKRTWLFILAALNPGDTVLGMNLAHGGHLTHGSPVNASGILYNFVLMA